MKRNDQTGRTSALPATPRACWGISLRQRRGQGLRVNVQGTARPQPERPETPENLSWRELRAFRHRRGQGVRGLGQINPRPGTRPEPPRGMTKHELHAWWQERHAQERREELAALAARP